MRFLSFYKTKKCNTKFIYLFIYLFIILPLLTFFIIGFRLDTEKTQSFRERRYLTTFPFSFLFQSEQLEKYISDHLPWREQLIDFYFESGFGRDLGTDKIIIGRKNFILKGQSMPRNLPTLPVYQNKIVFSGQQIKQFQTNVQKIADFAKKHNIKVYLIIPPQNMRVYHNYMPDYILRENNPSVSEQVEKALKNIVTVVSIEQTLIAKATEQFPLIYKTDTHWSEDGAYEAYQILMQAVQRDFKDLKPVTRNDYDIELTEKVWSPYLNFGRDHFDNGSIYLTELNYNVRYRHYVFKDQKNISLDWDNVFSSSDYLQGYPKRAYLIGDSFTYYMVPFLIPTFSHVKFYRYNAPNSLWGIHWKDRETDLLKDKTDILILLVSDQKLEELTRYF